jgi:SAM-dependent methyltransferase
MNPDLFSIKGAFMPGWNKDELLKLAAQFQQTRILLSAAELDIFTKLHEGPKNLDTLCDETGFDRRGLRILMDALAALGIVAKSQSGFYSAKDNVVAALSKNSPESVLSLVLHRGTMWKSWSNLTEIVRTGKNPQYERKEPRSRDDLESFIGAMDVIGKKMAQSVVASLDLTGFHRLLDVGGGSGVYTAAILDRAPDMRAVIFDLPEVIEIAKKRLTESGHIDRTDFTAGDYTKDELPAGADLTLLSAIIHINGRKGNRELYSRIHRALIPGGTLLIRDYIMNENRLAPPDGAVFAVNMLAATTGGDTYTFSEILEDLDQTGFKNVKLMNSGQNMDQIVSAQTPN